MNTSPPSTYYRDIFTIRKSIPRKLRFIAGLTAFVLVLLAWCILSYGGIVKPFFLPAPHTVAIAVVTLFQEHALLGDIKASFMRVTIGFVISAALALPIGTLMGSFKVAEAFFEPLNDFIRYMPVPAFIPLTILWLGVGDSAQVALIFIGTFFQLTIMVADSVSNIRRDYLESAYTLGCSKKRVLLKVILPAVFPAIYDDLRVAVGWAWSYLILAEVIAANIGLGHMIMQSQRYLQTENVIAGIIIIGLIGLLIDSVLKLGYRVLFPWSEKENA